jgi:hypothetical protein
MRGYRLDPDPNAKVADEHFAVIYVPRRGARDRFPENCVNIQPDESAARAAADAEKNLHAAKVIGPARSSEGLRVFYLVAWLEVVGVDD